MSTRTVGKILYTFLLALGLAGSAGGCDMIKKLTGDKSSDTKRDRDDDDDEDDDDDDDKKKSSSAEPSATASAAPSATASAEASASASAEPSASAEASADVPPDEDEVIRYTDEQVASGDYYTKKNFSVYQAADTTSKELGKVATGTLIELVAAHGGNWLLVKWPSGIGELSLGWMQIEQRQTTIQETQDKPDGSVKVPPTRPDAGDTRRPPVRLPDAGRLPIKRPTVPHR
jgi:hypothetical protein